MHPSTRNASLRGLARALTAIVFASAASIAAAAPCAGFDDVDNGSAFCPNVEWLRNRAVTLGCGSSLYCPNDPVSRLAMAAFLNRLGTALTPVLLRRELASGAVDLDANVVVCQSDAFAVTGFPRRAIVDASLSAVMPGEQLVTAVPVVSTNNGTTWDPVTPVAAQLKLLPGQWNSTTNFGHAALDVGSSLRFGVRVARTGAGSADLSDSRCQLRVLIFSRDGASPPF